MKNRILFGAAAIALFTASQANAAIVTTLYGDDDGFGIGATSGTIDATVSHAGAGEAAGTDVRLIGSSGTFLAPAFAPTGSFNPFVLTGPIVSATLTIRFGSFDSGPSPVDGPNLLFLDGIAVSPTFLNSFSSSSTDNIETLSFVLPSSFYASLADGSVSLNGTRISEDSGSGSFQIDFLRLTIETGAVPEPATWAMMLAGFGMVGGTMAMMLAGFGMVGGTMRYRRRNTTVSVG